MSRPSIDLSRYDNRSFDRGAPVWKEALWRLVQGLFFQPLWHLPSGLRVFWLRVFGAHIGQRAVIRAGVNVHFPWRLWLGDDVWIGEDCLILNLAEVKIGDSCCLSQRSVLCTGSHDYRKATFDLITRPIVVQRSSWIGACAFLGPGVTVGEGGVVAAGAVVIRSVPPGHLAKGNPAVASPIHPGPDSASPGR